MIDPEENSRFHLDNLNGDAIGYQEPLEESDEDYYQDEDLEGPSGNLEGPISKYRVGSKIGPLPSKSFTS